MTKVQYLIRRAVLKKMKEMEGETKEIKQKINSLRDEIAKLEKEDNENFSTRLEMADFVDKYLDQ